MTDELQFDTAEAETSGTDGGGVTCGVCANAITDRYYSAGDATFCEPCKQQFESWKNAEGGTGRFVRALVYGLGGGAVGAGIYYAILAITGYELGLVAIVVGVLVGGAVRAGSGRRGGWVYQGLAMALTYVAITSTYIPFVIEGLKDVGEKEEVVAVESGAPTGDAPPTADGAPAVVETSSAAAMPGPGDEEPLGAIAWIFIAILIVALAMAAPILAGFENVIGWVIIGIALYEAWKMNKRVDIEFIGPFEVAPPAP